MYVPVSSLVTGSMVRTSAPMPVVLFSGTEFLDQVMEVITLEMIISSLAHLSSNFCPLNVPLGGLVLMSIPSATEYKGLYKLGLEFIVSRCQPHMHT